VLVRNAPLPPDDTIVVYREDAQPLNNTAAPEDRDHDRAAEKRLVSGFTLSVI
jgi:hypothetical protein